VDESPCFLKLNTSDEKKPVDKSRRKFLIGLGGAAVVIALGGTYYYMSSRAPSPAMTTSAATTLPTVPPVTSGESAMPILRYLGTPFFIPQDAIVKWKELNGQDIDATYTECFIAAQKQIANPSAWDFGASCRHRALVTANVLQSIPVSQIPRWQTDKLADIFVHPEKYFSEEQANRFNYLLWADSGKSRTALVTVPCMWNFDSVTYLPEFVPHEEQGGSQTTIAYSELFSTEWKGRIALQDDGFQTFSEAANLLNATGQLSVSGALSSLTPSEVDQVYNYLLPIIKSGQVRAFWLAYADIVNLLSTKELYLASTWQPVCFDTRKAGTPAYYARLVHGPYFWFNANYVSNSGNAAAIADCVKVMNWTLEQWMQLLYTKQGYPSPAVGWEDYKSGMGAEFYDWFFNGKATYLPIADVMKDIWPDHTEYANLSPRIQNALFTPDTYFRQFWTGEPPRTGLPDPQGNLRDLGSVEDKEKITRYIIGPDLPENNDYYVTKFEQLKASVPT
jgi:spermidine/putrescine-binding protein